jgi:ectoine hydroxylase-related dioxygenase (phytanoyl-CoA dioxygenase family)
MSNFRVTASAIRIAISFASEPVTAKFTTLSLPGSVLPMSSANSIEGSFEYEVQGKPPVTLKAGDVLFVPAWVFHAAKNVGRGNAAELATYIVEKDKPLLVLASQLP